MANGLESNQRWVKSRGASLRTQFALHLEFALCQWLTRFLQKKPEANADAVANRGRQRFDEGDAAHQSDIKGTLEQVEYMEFKEREQRAEAVKFEKSLPELSAAEKEEIAREVASRNDFDRPAAAVIGWEESPRSPSPKHVGRPIVTALKPRGRCQRLRPTLC